MQDRKTPKRQYTDEFKIEAARLGESVGAHEAARRLGVPVATLDNWKRQRAGAGIAAPAVAASASALPMRRPVSELEAECSRLRRELADAKLDVEILRKTGQRTLQRDRDEVRLGIEKNRDEYTVSRLCRVLSVSRTGYCQWRVRSPSPRALANQVLDVKVAVIHQDSRRSYGRPRIVQQLRQQGECVSAERVRQSLQRQELRPVYRRAYVTTTDSAHRLPVAPNLLDRCFDSWEPNRAWVGDITYVATNEV